MMRAHRHRAAVDSASAASARRRPRAGDARAQLRRLQRKAGNRSLAAAAPVLARDVSSWWHAVEITAVDSRADATMPWYYPPRYAGPGGSATHMNTVSMTSVRTMVDGVLAKLGTEDKIKRLNIVDHGNTSGIEIGDEWITAANVSTYAAELRRLRGHFTQDGFVHLAHCEAGATGTLAAQLAAIWGVRVVAGKGLSNPIYRFNLGDYVDTNPNGTTSEHWWGPFFR